MLWQRRAGRQGLALALEKDAAVGEEFTLGGTAVFRWDDHAPWFAERHGLEYVDARLPESASFEFDLSKIKGLLGYEPRHDVRSVVETVEAMRRARRRASGTVDGSDGHPASAGVVAAPTRLSHRLSVGK